MASTTLRGIVSRLTTPLLPDDYLQLVNPLWSARELRGVVVEVVPETEQAATLVIKPGWGWSRQYRAGQGGAGRWAREARVRGPGRAARGGAVGWLRRRTRGSRGVVFFFFPLVSDR